MGMFLRLRTPYELQKAVDNLPEPHDVYQTMIRRLKTKWDGPGRHWAKKILTWVCFAQWTLSPRHLLYIIGLDLENPKIDHTNILRPESRLTSLCDGLVLVNEASQKVSIFHLDVLQYFQKNEQSYFPEAHRDIVEMCIAQIKAASALGRSVLDHPLWAFTFHCIKYLGYHVRAYMAQIEPERRPLIRRLTSQSLTASDESEMPTELQEKIATSEGAGLCDKLASLLNDEKCLLLLNIVMVQNRIHSSEERLDGDGASKLHIAAAMGLLDTTQRLAEDNRLLHVEDNFGRTALGVAIEWKHKDIAEALVKLGSCVNLEQSSGQTIFGMAVSQRDFQFAQNLLEAAETPQRHRFMSKSRLRTNEFVSLLSAVFNNNETAVTRLCTNTKVRKSHAAATALLVAADCGHEKILKLLLDMDVPVNTRDIGDRTALHRAAYRNDISMVNTLLRHGADVNAMDKAGYTPWSEALLMPGHEDVEKILVSWSANVNPSDCDGRSVLYMSAAGGHIFIVDKLIEAGADPSVRTVYGWTPLVSYSKYTLLCLSNTY